MSLSQAKAIADEPAGHPVEKLLLAQSRLAGTASNGGLRNSQRAASKLYRRWERLNEAIAKSQWRA